MGSCTSKTSPSSPPAPASEKRAAQNNKLQSSRAEPQEKETLAAGTANGAANGAAPAPANHSSLPGSAAQSASGADQNSSVASTDRDVKILLLGSGESGKSTIVKQMKILHKDGFSQAEAHDYKPFVYKNVLDCVKNIIAAVLDLDRGLVDGSHTSLSTTSSDPGPEKLPVLQHDDLQAMLHYDLSVNEDLPFDPEIAAKIKAFYAHEEVQEFIRLNQGKFHLIDSTDYFLSAIDRIAAPDYLPTQTDILRTRKKTSGIFDFRFQMGSSNIHMFDVGGQRSERKKWIHCFDNVTLIIFCVALSEYDQVLLEENSQNRLEESLALFDSVVNSRWFSRTSVVLFLNKIDVLANKLPYSPLEDHFADYNGGNNLNKAVKYILWRFTQINRSGLNIYPHVTQATDTSNVELVFAALKETILENTLRDSGIL